MTTWVLWTTAVALSAGCTGTIGSLPAATRADGTDAGSAPTTGDPDAGPDPIEMETNPCGFRPEPELEPGSVAPPSFSVDRGFFDSTFDLVVSSDTAGATISYTLDGSTPTPTHGTQAAAPVTLPVETTSIVRAMAFHESMTSARVVTHTYVFIEDVLTQPEAPEGFPRHELSLNSDTTAPLTYGMDPDVVNDPAYSDRMVEALTSIPSISIVMPYEDLFGDDGLYFQGGGDPGADAAFERGGSIELLDPNRPGHQLQIDGSVRTHSHRKLKRSLRLSFKAEYGPTKLRSCIFRDAPQNAASATNKFDRIILRAGTNRTWSAWWNVDDTAYTRDQWARDSQIALSGIGSHGTFVHLYLNGMYWGLYNAVERPDAWFTSEYLGGAKEDWLSVNHGGPLQGDTGRWDYLAGTVLSRDLTDSSNYAELTGHVDLPQYFDYLIVNWYAGTSDWPQNNWYAGVQTSPPGRVMFFSWDAEDIWDGTASSGPNDQPGGRGNDGAWVPPAFMRVAPDSSWSTTRGREAVIAQIWHRGRENRDFMTAFADRVYRACFHEGALTVESSQARWRALNEHIALAVLGESARWGDAIAVLDGRTRTPDESWRPEVESVYDESMPGNVDRFIAALRAEGYYPPIDPPTLSQHGGVVEDSFALTMDTAGGTIHYSWDGTDPREPGGNVASSANTYGGPATVPSGTSRLMARVRDGDTWSALTQADFESM